MENTIVIRNPLIFFNEDYLERKALTGEFSGGRQKIILFHEMPSQVLITFKNKELVDQFISKYNDKFFEENFEYKLKIEVYTGTFEALRDEIKKNETQLTPIPYYYSYEQMVFNEYIKSKEEPGLIFTNEEEKSKIERGVAWLLKKLGSNIISGQSIMTISLPVFLFDKRTLHEVFCYEHRAAPFYLSHAAYCTDKFERMKWVIVYTISQLYISTIQSKPFNPIIGETFQCKIGPLNMYTEQTVNHPITSNFYAFDDDNLYKIHGYIITTASTGANTISAIKKGKYQITFKDGTLYTIHLPAVLIKGITVGKRLFNYVKKMLVIDETNKYCAYISMNPDEPGFFKSWFTSKQGTFPDTFAGKVVKLEDVKIDPKDTDHKLEKNAQEFIQIKGEWTKNVIFDDEEYWDIETYPLLTVHEVGYKCPSDGRFRPDLIALVKNDQETSQKEKEKLENIQRADRKLRANWLKEEKKRNKDK